MKPGVTIALFALFGVCAGGLHFALLQRNVDSIIAGASPLATVAAVLARFVLTAGIFILAAILSGINVVWMLVGFVVARIAAVKIAQGRA